MPRWAPPAPRYCQSPPDSTVHLVPLEPNIIYKTSNWRNKYLALNTGTFVLYEQTLPGGGGLTPCLHLGMGSTDPQGLAGVTWAVSSREALRSLTPINPLLSPCHREPCTPFACLQDQWCWGWQGGDDWGTWEGCPGRDGAVKQKHLPQVHPACVRRQRLLRDAPLACHQCSFFSSRSYCAPLSTLGSFARLILPGIHSLWTWENNASP